MKQLVETLRYALPHKPWLAFPEDQPFGDADTYFETVCGMDLNGLLAVVRSMDQQAADELEELRGRCNNAQDDAQLAGNHRSRRRGVAEGLLLR
jgi:hypothetical protein